MSETNKTTHYGTPAVVPPAPADRAAAIAAAIGPTMLLSLQDAELAGAQGAERIRDWVKWISETVAALPAAVPVDRASVLRWAADEVQQMLAAEPDDTRALALHDVLTQVRAKFPCTCARSQGLHERACQRYVPGHELLSPARRLAAARAELRRLADEAPQPEAVAHPPRTEWQIEFHWRGEWRPDGPAWEQREDAASRYESAITRPGARAQRLVRQTATYAIEAEQQPEAAEGVQR
jgi:hypothetical protein